MEIDKPNLGDKTFSKVVEMGIATQLDEAEVINVDIRTNPGKLVQGKLDSVTISGKGLVNEARSADGNGRSQHRQSGD
jgi:LmeA-like phospholipid-binding